ncbi:MAG: hypothetical protein KY476_09070, partial [Planctomycetes bacterium]|nr:hypothetical protein [Planctomycetota bacterium]
MLRYHECHRPRGLGLGRLTLLALGFAVGAGFVAGGIGGLTPAARLLRAEDWPQFRGPNSSGIATSDAPLPVEFSATTNVAWKAELGDGIGSPVVAAGRVFTAGMADASTVALSAFDAETGRKLWERRW